MNALMERTGRSKVRPFQGNKGNLVPYHSFREMPKQYLLNRPLTKGPEDYQEIHVPLAIRHSRVKTVPGRPREIHDYVHRRDSHHPAGMGRGGKALPPDT